MTLMTMHDDKATGYATVLCLAWVLLCPWSGAEADVATFETDTRVIASRPHRLAATENLLKAAAHIESRLKEIGVDKVVMHDIPTTQLFHLGSSIEILPFEEMALAVQKDSVDTSDSAGRARPGLPTRRTLELLPMRPNGILPPNTFDGPIEGQLLIAGKGELTDYGTRNPSGKIVVLDYNSSESWLRAFRLGAQAVVFVRREPMSARHFHHTPQEAPLPRYFFPGDPAELQEGRRAVIRSKSTWRKSTGRNVYAFIQGKSPEFLLQRPEMVILAAQMDSYGEVPELSPGARGAANCAALLQIAERLVARRPDRNILLAFLDVESRGHLGSGKMYRVLDELDGRLVYAQIDERLKSLEKEAEFYQALERQLTVRNPFSLELNDVRKKYFDRLKKRADFRAYAMGDELRELRLREKELRITLDSLLDLSRGSESEPRISEKSLDSVQQVFDSLGQLIEQKDATKLLWGEVRRSLNRQQWSDSIAALMDTIRLTEKRLVTERLAEIGRLQEIIEQEKELKALKGDSWITYHLSVDLSDRSPKWGVFAGGDSKNLNGKPSENARLLDAFYAAVSGGLHTRIPNFDTATVSGIIKPRFFWPGPMTHSGETASQLGIYNVVAGTIQDPRLKHGTPEDLPDSLDYRTMYLQVEELAELVHHTSSLDRFSLRRSILSSNRIYHEQRWMEGFQKAQGYHALESRKGGGFGDREAPEVTVKVTLGAVAGVSYQYNPIKIPAFDDFQVHWTNANGFLVMGPVPKNGLNAVGIRFSPQGDIELVSRKAGINQGGEGVVFNRDKRLMMMHLVHHGALILPPQLYPEPVKPYNARANSPVAEDEMNVSTWDGMFHFFFSEKIERYKIFSGDFSQQARYPAMVLLNNGEDSAVDHAYKDALGDGYLSSVSRAEFPVSLFSGMDLWRLNEDRLEMMRRRGIMNSSLEELHGRSEDLLTEATETDSLAQAEALAASGFLGERPVHMKSRSALNDLILSVLFLLVLTVPFAFVLERLLVSSTSIYKMLYWFIAFFALTFFILYKTHPAFSLSATPLVIFLGFTVLILAGMVIVIIMQKFGTELKVLQGLSGTVHTADVSRFGTLFAAMSMGLSSMRRRPLRTTLTAITIILLTFTILCFSSFSSSTGISKSFVSSLPRYSTALVHQNRLNQLGPFVRELAEGRWGEHRVHLRYWLPHEQIELVPNAVTDELFREILVSHMSRGNHFLASSVLGISQEEIALRPDLAFMALDTVSAQADWALVPELMAEYLGVSTGDTVRAAGFDLVVRGILSAAELSGAVDINGLGITPMVSKVPNLKAALEGDKQMDAAVGEATEPLPTPSTLIVSPKVAVLMGATPRIALVYTKDNGNAFDVGEEMARIFPENIFVTGEDGVYRLSLSQKAKATGASDLFFPILLGGLVILGTMLGSVADREREIYTFSALGLAPSHVAGLFFAEALVYSILGGLGGYLVAQGFTTILGVFAEYGVVQAPSINYSSTNAIVTLLIVMGVVILSSVYPAIKAARGANSGVMRQWRMPEPDGDRFEFAFPFTVSAYDITGVVSFLKEHFDRFSDTSLGTFMAQECRILEGKSDNLGLAADVALAPFELGVNQKFQLMSAPSEIPGIDEVRIRIKRTSGQPEDWKRLNKNLLKDLRQQFLIWRALPKESMELYRDRTLQHMGRKRKGETEVVS